MLKRYMIFFCLVSLLAGCRNTPAPPPPPSVPPVAPPPTPRTAATTKPGIAVDRKLPKTLAAPPMRIVARPIGAGPKDPPPPIRLTTRFEIYDITLPLGAVSRNDAFWKLIDEARIDPGTYDVLRRNGVRVGVAPVADWPLLRDLLAEVPTTTQLSSATGREGSNIEMTMKRDIISQSIFVFLPNGRLVGRTFERCDNLLALSFQQTPRKAGQLSVSMSPIVRSTRKHMTFSTLGNEQEFAYVYPEKALDVSLRAEIPLDHLLVIAPSEEANATTSLGRTFFMHDTPADKQERVLVLAPRMFRIETEANARSK